MATPYTLPSICIMFFVLFFVCPTPALSKKSTYIVHMLHSHKPDTFASPKEWYSSILHSLSSTSNTSTNLLYTYSHSATGFAAHITTAHAAKLRRLPSVLSVVPDEMVEPDTTQTPSFLGLSRGSGICYDTNSGSDTIIGVIDSGIWPESVSFHDEGLSSVPAKWRGFCQGGPDFPASSCNNKIIGARFFYKGYEAENGPLAEIKSARDASGHGTHCASTAGGSGVSDAGYHWYALGKASGVAENARIAAYKVFWGKKSKGSTADILKAIDEAIYDGVDVISMSISTSGTEVLPYHEDLKATASFRAMQNGVVFSASAGNTGPKSSTVKNVSPWMLTVAASTIDRKFPANVVLGNGKVFKGSSLYNFRHTSTNSTASLMLVTGQQGRSRYCKAGELVRSVIAGKMVICEAAGNPVAQSFAVKQAGGLGMILITQDQHNEGLRATPFIIPATSVTKIDGDQIKAYVSSTSYPMATIVFKGTVISSTPSSPRLATFSSRGPNSITPEILKPDVTAPGVHILAAWSGNIAPSKLDIDKRRVDYNILSGTSMACPHVSGLGALLKKAHPRWSPAAIKSAIMTTSYNVDNAGNYLIDIASGERSTPFIHGSGHIYPQRALDPGLVYDLDTTDYIAFLCSIGYTYRRIAQFVQDTSLIDCRAKNLSRPGDLNYPSFSVPFKSAKDVVRYTRVVKNVGKSVNAVYQVKVTNPGYVQVSVSPKRLVFSANKQTLSYTITFTSTFESYWIPTPQLTIRYGSIIWTDSNNNYRVRSPIAVYWPFETAKDNLVASL